MKNILVLISVLSTLLASCTKEFPVPTVQIQKVETIDGKTIVHLAINNPKGAEITYAGVNYKFGGYSDEYFNYELMNEATNTVTLELSSETVYDLQAFVSTEYSVEYSNTTYLVPEYIPNIPCEVETNTFEINGYNYNAPYTNSSDFSDYNVDIEIIGISRYRVRLQFKSEPTSGEYRLVRNVDNYLSTDRVAEIAYIKRSSSFQDYYCDDYKDANLDKVLYIKNVDSQRKSLSLCDIDFSYNGTEYTMNGSTDFWY